MKWYSAHLKTVHFKQMSAQHLILISQETINDFRDTVVRQTQSHGDVSPLQNTIICGSNNEPNEESENIDSLKCLRDCYSRKVTRLESVAVTHKSST